MATIRDVAKRADVSIATASRVINNSSHTVNPATRARVLAAIAELDYAPNAVAKNLSMRRAQTIEVVIPDISNPYYAEIVRGVQDVADEAHYTVILQNTDRQSQKALDGVRLLREKLVDGIIFGGGVIPGQEVSAAMGQSPNRAVVVGRQPVSFPAVRIDNAEACADVVRHLASLGHRRIAFLSGPRESKTMEDRYAGYLEGLKRHRCEQDEQLVSWGALTLEDGFNRSGALISLGAKRPTAIVAGNDQIAIGAIRAAQQAGLDVPDDIAVTGFDNIPLSQYFQPALTTIDIPRYRMGKAAMTLLLNMFLGKEVQPVIWLPTRLIVRASSKQ